MNTSASKKNKSAKTVVYTSAALNYLPKVRKLFASVRKHHPEFELVLALADRLPESVDFSREPLDRVITVEQLDIPDRTRWIYFHTLVELATAIKPFVMSSLLREPDVGRVIYLDPDIVLFSRIDDIVSVLHKANIALTPHQTEPETTQAAIEDNEICSLKHGIYNLGFIAVRNTDESRRFAQWWSDRVYHYCVADIPNGLFTDQRWIDFVPVFFNGVHILKSPRFNVATWNLTTRKLSGDQERGYKVNGEPLGFYHFTGFDSGAHRLMATKNAPENDAVTSLVDWYTEQTKFDDLDPISHQTWGYANYDDGSPIPLQHRRYYRSRSDLREAMPDPFAMVDDLNVQNWMIYQGPVERPDLFEALPPEVVEMEDGVELAEGTEVPEVIEAVEIVEVVEVIDVIDVIDVIEEPEMAETLEVEESAAVDIVPHDPSNVGLKRMFGAVGKFFQSSAYRQEITGNLWAVLREKGPLGLLSYIFKF